ncbi:MAG: VOC family protein [Phycisphaerales bacterium]|nr:VOC family protein [Phycisphaerales bacterium]
MKQTVFIFLLFFSSSVLFAQGDQKFDFKFNHLTHYVYNVDSSVAFYERVLQLKEIPNRAKSKGERWMSLGGQLEMHLINIGTKTLVVDSSHFALSTAHFDAFLKHIQSLKINYFDTDDHRNYDPTHRTHNFNIRADGVKQIYFQDPNGYWIEVNDIH